MRCLLALIFALLITAATAHAADWPTLGQNPQRTGFTADDPKGPYEPKWARGDLVQENILCWVEPIVADGRVYLGTGAGNVLALDRNDGHTLWKTALASPVMHSVAYHDGKLFAGVQGGWSGAFVVALDAKTGAVLWKTPTPQGGFWTSPAVADGLVLLGSRDGNFYAFDESTGAIKWRIATGGPILQSAAVANGRAFFASEDMHAYGIEIATGKVIWTSEQLEGKTFRGYAPVVWKDKVVFRSASTIIYAAYEVEGQLMYDEWAGWPRNYQGLVQPVDGKALNPAFRTEWEKAPAADKDKYTYSAIKARKWDYFTPQRVQQENEAYREKLRQRPALRSAFMLDQADGIQRAVLPIDYASGCACTAVPPTVDADGNLWVIFKSFYSNWDTPIRAHDAIGIYDLKSEAVKLVQYEPKDPKQNPMRTFFHITSDETNHLTVAGLTLWNQHGTNGSRGWYVGAMDIASKKFTYGVGGEGATYPKAFGLNEAPSAGSSGQVGGTVVSDTQVFNLVSSILTCIGPKGTGEVHMGATATSDPSLAPAGVPTPVMIEKGTPVTAEQLVAESLQPGQIPANSAGAAQPVRQRLAQVVRQTIDGGPWVPWRVAGGMCINPLLGGGDQFYFALPSDTLAALSEAYPHLDPDLQKQVNAYFSNEWDRFKPWTNSVYAGSDPTTRYGQSPQDLQQREAYRLGHWLYGPYPQNSGIGGAMSNGQLSPVANHYAMWLYAQNLDQWDRVKGVWEEMKMTFAAFVEKPYKPAGDLMKTNWYIEGLIGHARIARHLGDTAEADKAMAELRLLLEARKAVELAGNGTGKDIYRGRYDQMCPELWRYLIGAAAEQVHAEWLPDIEGRSNEPRIAALFYAWGVGPHESRNHEAYVTPPSTVLAAFQAKAFLYKTPPAELRDFVDMPWVKADLYYIEKLVLTLDVFSGTEWSAK